MLERLSGALASLFLLSSALAAPAHAAGAARYHVTMLPPSLAASSGGYAINSQGQVAGFDEVGHAALFDGRGGETDLGTLPGGYESVAHGINDSGRVVGASTAAGVGQLPFRWANGTMTVLPLLPGASWPSGAAYAINKYGQIAGSATGADGYAHPVIWKNSTITDLGLTHGSTHAEGRAINVGGHVAGVATVKGGRSHAYFWHDGKAVDLQAGQDDVDADAAGINDHDQIVGRTTVTLSTGASVYEAFVYHKGALTPLGLLQPGDQYSEAAAINDDGVIVGDGGGMRDGRYVRLAFVCVDGRMTELDTLVDDTSAGWVLQTADAINAKGQITGAGVFEGVPIAYIATPVN